MLISFEGIDGSGKSTHIRLLEEWLTARGKEVLCLREPGGTKISEEIRNILLHTKETMSIKTELLLFEAARAQLVEEIIKPALEKGKWILTDRFFDSTLVYQGYGRGLDIDYIDSLNKFATSDICPDLTIYLKISLQKSLERMANRKNIDRIEASALEFHQKLYDGFEKLALGNSDRIITVDSSYPPKVTFINILEKIEKKLK